MRGQTLIELVVVVAVIAMVVGALVFATIASLRNANLAQNQAQATKLAQEGIERVRTGRDRNECITNLSTNVNSWNGNSSNLSCSGAGAIWDYQINNGNCGNPTATPSLFCYFNVTDQGTLNHLTASPTMPAQAEVIPPDNMFRRAIILSDDSSSYLTQKTVTSIVIWTDFAGEHESRLTTILRRL